ncbi:MAG: hypothetical protein D6796_13630 [Caldilineae bacterium]|nr:MAG: hypothetical protein D6796_13630 [Caldilineae bacterium]
MKNYGKFAGILALLAVLFVLPFAAQADDNGMEWTGTISSRPAGVAGTWVIGGISFTANASTQLEQEHGRTLNVGDCAQVNYYVSGGQKIATKISAEDAYKCSGGGEGDTSEHLKLYGHLQSQPPADPHNGTWVVEGVTYVSNASTKIEYKAGDFRVGGCVEVEYTSGSNIAREIETAYDYKCTNTGGGMNPGEAYSQVYAVLFDFPPGLVGTWTMGGGDTYEATAATRFEQENGPFFQGVCLDIKFSTDPNTGVKTAAEISTTEAFKCGNTGGATGSDPVENKFYGLIESMPANPSAGGDWTIGGIPFTSSAATQLEQEHTPLAVGVCAEVEYYQDANGVNQATKIAADDPYKCNTGTYTYEVYGTVNVMPTGLYGSWVIASSGLITDTYNTSVNTTFKQEHGSFAPGVCVKVKYYIQNGVNHVTELETQEANHCGSGGDSGTTLPPPAPDDLKVYATVNSMPSGSGSLFIGTWVIGGITYQSDANTRFETEHGSLALSTCVKAKYVFSGTTRLLTKVETQQPYKCQQSGGGGDEFKSYGVVEGLPAGFASGVLTGTWRISGEDYQATSATQFKQEHGFFGIGAYVEVKYTVSGTVKTATSIETHLSTGADQNIVTGDLEAHDVTDDWSDWTVDGVTYKADPAIEVDPDIHNLTLRTAATPQVILRTYRSLDGITYVTVAHLVKSQLFLPIILR